MVLKESETKSTARSCIITNQRGKKREKKKIKSFSSKKIKYLSWLPGNLPQTLLPFPSLAETNYLHFAFCYDNLRGDKLCFFSPEHLPHLSCIISDKVRLGCCHPTPKSCSCVHSWPEPLMSCLIVLGEPRMWDRQKTGAGIKMLGSWDWVSPQKVLRFYTELLWIKFSVSSNPVCVCVC